MHEYVLYGLVGLASIAAIFFLILAIRGFINMPPERRRPIIIAIMVTLMIASLVVLIIKLCGFWLYWLFVFLVIVGIIVASIINEAVRGYFGKLLAQICSDNNYRSGALFALAIVFTFSAFFAGLGEPILVSSTREFTAPMIESAKSNEKLTSEINYLLWGKKAEEKDESKQKTSSTSQHYHSWWHTIIAIFFWVAAIIYFPISRIDEAKNAWREARRNLRIRRGGNRTGSVSTAIGGSANATGTAQVITLKDSFLRLFSIDILAEFVPLFVSNITKKLFK